MSGIAWRLQVQADQVALTAANAKPIPVPGTPDWKAQATAAENTVEAPPQESHLDDLERLFKLAKDKNLAIGTVEYRTEALLGTNATVIRTLDLRVSEDYGKLKLFISELLQSMPHATLQEIRIERKDGASLQGQVMLKLAFVYQTQATASATQKMGNP